ncbi:NUDIX hydrolase [Flammeovirgaceae bacterium 311]|nr:NUDIX hydrolase [Flammeovirgaceae bacterium 311]
MTRNHLLAELRLYKPYSQREQEHLRKITSLLEREGDCFLRSRADGHFTASAWVVSPDLQQVLLMHHRKLDKWLQPGGHADGDTNLPGVALREAHEESGLTSLRLLRTEIFDVDVHPIPARGDEKEHYHYDLRYLLTANPNEKLLPNGESKGFAWVSVHEVEKLTAANPSILRMVNKTLQLPVVGI